MSWSRDIILGEALASRWKVKAWLQELFIRGNKTRRKKRG